MVVLEAFIVVVVGLSGYLGVLVEDSVFLYRRLALHHDGAQEHGAHQHVHHFSSLGDRTVLVSCLTKWAHKESKAALETLPPLLSCFYRFNGPEPD